MNELLFAIAMSCAAPKLENRTKYPWNDFDKESLNIASNNCKKFYRKSPCLKIFRKVGKQDYHAICSKEI
jgi:hypothetical protein